MTHLEQYKAFLEERNIKYVQIAVEGLSTLAVDISDVSEECIKELDEFTAKLKESLQSTDL